MSQLKNTAVRTPGILDHDCILPWMAVGWLVLWALPAQAIVCSVPGGHPTIQEAVDDPTCTEVELEAGTYEESVQVSRTLMISGPVGRGTVLQGRFTALGSSTVVDLVDLVVENGCASAALTSLQGARVEGLGLEVVRQTGLPCSVETIFSDGFETGDTSAWSSSVD